LCELPAAWNTPDLGDPSDPQWRNRLASRIFEEETRLAARHYLRFRQNALEPPRWDTVIRAAEVLPFELLGVPLALFSAELPPAGGGRQFFLDRASVARPGGRSAPRTRPAVRLATDASDEALTPPGSGTARTWRARVDQFVEQVGLYPLTTDAQVSAVASHFQFVPPVGFLPRQMLTLMTTAEALAIPPGPNQAPDRAGVNHFFPASFAVEAAPVALEDMDAVLAASASLAPYDFRPGDDDTVRMLVPLPQRVFDPRLLVVEQEDPAFAETVGRFVATRQDWRQRRDVVRRRRDALQTLATGPLRPVLTLLVERGQLEPEPVETGASLNFSAALLSPTATSGPWNVNLTFAATQQVSQGAILFLEMRVDVEAVPTRIEARWRRGATEGAFAWTAPPAAPHEQRDETGQPLATPLWLRFTVPASDLGITEAVDGVTVQVDNGRAALGSVGQLVPLQGADEFTSVFWWRGQDTEPAPAFVGGDWTSISGDRLLAPFENPFEVLFADGQPLGQRVADLEAAFNPGGITPRTPVFSIASAGLERVLAQMESEASEADDFVDVNFTRAQVNLYRIRKLVLGEKAAQRLLVNPAIATIAEQETATASAEQLESFFTAAKRTEVNAEDVNDALGLNDVRALTAPQFLAAERINPIVTETKTDATFAKAALLASAANLTTNTQIAGTFSKQALLKDVLGERPESGPTLPPRGISIGQRFADAPAAENLAYARSALTQFVHLLPKLRLPLAGDVRSVDGQADVSLTALQGRAAATSQQTSEQLRQAAEARLLNVTRLTAKTDVAEVTLAALDFTEAKTAILRTIEGLVQQQRAAIQRGIELLAAVVAQRDGAAGRLLAIDGKLTEARHDVSVARALRQEELERVDAINARRDALIRDEVRFLAYVRPRAVDTARRNLSYWKLDPFGTVAPVPACLREHDEPPAALNAYLQLFRHAPTRWFPKLQPLLLKLDTPDKLIALLDTTRIAAASFQALDAPGLVSTSSQTVQATVLGAQQMISVIRQRSTVIQVADARSKPWTDFHRQALEHSAIGDLIAGRHGARDVSSAAARELELIGQLATCLHAEFAAVTPAVRLSWVERFSQFDKPSLLRDLTVLPGYGHLDRPSRRRLQEFVDALFGRVTAAERDAITFVNDLVRICLLLASHAPVNRIIAGHLPRPLPVSPGILIPIRPLAPELVRVGMEFHVWQASRIVASGRVTDLREGEVSAQVDHVDVQTTSLDPAMQVQFVAPGLSFGK
jgi:hypothetical protein